jgi:hypothetical protein
MTAIAAARVTASWRFEGRTPGRLLLLLVAWGTLLFGAVNPWAYVPLLIPAGGIERVEIDSAGGGRFVARPRR